MTQSFGSRPALGHCSPVPSLISTFTAVYRSTGVALPSAIVGSPNDELGLTNAAVRFSEANETRRFVVGFGPPSTARATRLAATPSFSTKVSAVRATSAVLRDFDFHAAAAPFGDECIRWAPVSTVAVFSPTVHNMRAHGSPSLCVSDSIPVRARAGLARASGISKPFKPTEHQTARPSVRRRANSRVPLPARSNAILRKASIGTSGLRVADPDRALVARSRLEARLSSGPSPSSNHHTDVVTFVKQSDAPALFLALNEHHRVATGVH